MPERSEWTRKFTKRTRRRYRKSSGHLGRSPPAMRLLYDPKGKRSAELVRLPPNAFLPTNADACDRMLRITSCAYSWIRPSQIRAFYAFPIFRFQKRVLSHFRFLIVKKGELNYVISRRIVVRNSNFTFTSRNNSSSPFRLLFLTFHKAQPFQRIKSIIFVQRFQFSQDCYSLISEINK